MHPEDKPAESNRGPQAESPSGESQPPLPPEVPVSRLTGPNVDERKFAQISRRELLKLAPVLAFGVFAVPSAQEWLLKKGLGFSDWASARLFRRARQAKS